MTKPPVPAAMVERLIGETATGRSVVRSSWLELHHPARYPMNVIY